MFLFDAHCDTITTARAQDKSLYENDLRVSVKRLLEYDAPVQVFSVWLDKAYHDEAFAATRYFYDFFERQAGAVPDKLAVARTYADIENNRKNGVVTALLGIEGGEALEGDIEKLRKLYALGTRVVTLTWNHINALGCGAFASPPPGEAEDFPPGQIAEDTGLTEFGAEVIAEMNRLGMIADVSHLSRNSFRDALRYAQKPFIASHSNCYEICKHRRNLTDAEIKQLAENGGVMGINFCDTFLKEGGGSDIGDILRHIGHVVKLVGDGHIGLGCDFDGIEKGPAGFDSVSDLKKLFAALERKYGVTTAEKIFGGNFMRVARQIL